MNTDIMGYIKRKYNLIIGERSAENIKITIGSAFPDENNNETMEIRGRDAVSGMPKSLTISAVRLKKHCTIRLCKLLWLLKKY